MAHDVGLVLVVSRPFIRKIVHMGYWFLSQFWIVMDKVFMWVILKWVVASFGFCCLFLCEWDILFGKKYEKMISFKWSFAWAPLYVTLCLYSKVPSYYCNSMIHPLLRTLTLCNTERRNCLTSTLIYLWWKIYLLCVSPPSKQPLTDAIAWKPWWKISDCWVVLLIPI